MLGSFNGKGWHSPIMADELKANLYPKLNLSRRAQREDARSRAYASGKAIGRGGSVGFTRVAIQDATKPVARPVKVGQVEQIKRRSSWLEGESIAYFEWPGKG